MLESVGPPVPRLKNIDEDIFDPVRELAAELPEAEESTHYGTPAFKVRGKMFVRLHEMGDVLVVRVPMHERAAIMTAEPDKYFITPTTTTIR